MLRTCAHCPYIRQNEPHVSMRRHLLPPENCYFVPALLSSQPLPSLVGATPFVVLEFRENQPAACSDTKTRQWLQLTCPQAPTLPYPCTKLERVNCPDACQDHLSFISYSKQCSDSRLLFFSPAGTRTASGKTTYPYRIPCTRVPGIGAPTTRSN